MCEIHHAAKNSSILWKKVVTKKTEFLHRFHWKTKNNHLSSSRNNSFHDYGRIMVQESYNHYQQENIHSSLSVEVQEESVY